MPRQHNFRSKITKNDQILDSLIDIFVLKWLKITKNTRKYFNDKWCLRQFIISKQQYK